MSEYTEKICCLCGRPIGDLFGNNPWPLVKDENARCCNECNMSKVIPARIELIKKHSEKEKNENYAGEN